MLSFLAPGQVTHYQSLHAYGGLLPLVTSAGFAPAARPEAIRAMSYIVSPRRGTAPSADPPAFDALVEEPTLTASGVTYRSRRIRCLPSPTQLTVPEALRGRGPVHTIACAATANEDSEWLAEANAKASLGFRNASVFFWVREAGVAIPAALFMLDSKALPDDATYWMPWGTLRHRTRSPATGVPTFGSPAFEWIDESNPK